MMFAEYPCNLFGKVVTAMGTFYQEALHIQERIHETRVWLHRHPELGLDLPETAAYVENRLKELGYTPRRLGRCGIVAQLGKPGGKCILLRADMDALPVEEQTELSCRSTNGNMHACGHDCHTAALLGAAQLLKAHEAELDGMVKLMFQPAEETMDGGKMMLEAGILENPTVDAAFSLHVFPNLPMKPGTLLLPGTAAGFAAVDWFTIRIQGKGSHGAQPHNGVDPLNVMSHIHLALQAINARETDPCQPLVLTIGQMHGGSTSNVIPSEATMSGTIRTLSSNVRNRVKTRMEALVTATAAAFGAKAWVEYGSGCPPLKQDKALYARIKDICGNLDGIDVMDANQWGLPASGGMGSEDFSHIAERVPAVFAIVAAGRPEDGYVYPVHHPNACFDTAALPAAAAIYAHIAAHWLKQAD